MKEVKFLANQIRVVAKHEYDTYFEVEVILTDGEKEQYQTWTLWDGEQWKNLMPVWNDEDVKKRLKELINT